MQHWIDRTPFFATRTHGQTRIWKFTPARDSSVYVCGLGGSEHCGKARIMELEPHLVVGDTFRIEAAQKCLRNMSSKSFKTMGGRVQLLHAALPTRWKAYHGSNTKLHQCLRMLWPQLLGYFMRDPFRASAWQSS